MQASGLPTIAPAWGGHVDFMNGAVGWATSSQTNHHTQEGEGADIHKPEREEQGHGETTKESQIEKDDDKADAPQSGANGGSGQVAYLVDVERELVPVSGPGWDLHHGHHWAQVQLRALQAMLRLVTEAGNADVVAQTAAAGSAYVHSRYTQRDVARSVDAALIAASARWLAAEQTKPAIDDVIRGDGRAGHADWEFHQRAMSGG